MINLGYVALPTPPATMLSDIAAISRTEAWAVGANDRGEFQVWRWGGRRWTALTLPAVARVNSFASIENSRDAAVVASGPARAYLVGLGGLPDGPLPTGWLGPLVLRWDGHAWQIVFCPLLPPEKALGGSMPLHLSMAGCGPWEEGRRCAAGRSPVARTRRIGTRSCSSEPRRRSAG